MPSSWAGKQKNPQKNPPQYGGTPRKSAILRPFLYRSPPPNSPFPPMFHGTRPGWIEVIAGVMFSGKSEELVRRVRRAVIAKKRVQVFKSHLDARYAGLYSVSTHDGGTVEAEPGDSSGGGLRAGGPR